MRPDIHTYYLGIAGLVAQRSTCPRAAIGAVLTNNGYIISTGYNGAPQRLPHCFDAGCRIVKDHCIRTVHAEMNAIIQAARNHGGALGATLYCTHSPCVLCAQIIINAGVHAVVYQTIYQDDRDNAIQLLSAAGVLVQCGTVIL